MRSIKKIILISGIIFGLISIYYAPAINAYSDKALNKSLNVIGNYINDKFDLDAKKAVSEIELAIALGDYEKANDLYVKRQDAAVGTPAYNNLSKVRDIIEYYRRYRSSIDLFNSNVANKDWGIIINNLSNMPEGFKFKNEVENMLSQATKEQKKKNSTDSFVNNQVVTNPTTTNNNAGKMDCVGPDGKHLWLTPEDCLNFNLAWGNVKKATPAVTATLKQPVPPSYSNYISITCVTVYGTYIEYGKDYAEAQKYCDDLKSNALSMQKKNNDLLNSYNNSTHTTSSNQPSNTDIMYEVEKYNQQVQSCRNSVSSKYTGLVQSCNQYGGSSAYDACRAAYGEQRGKEYAACGQEIQ